MTAPVVAARSPIVVDLEAGDTFLWCACGRSANQPYCDGSHEGTGITPLRFVAAESGLVWFCRCKHSAKAPLCDGTHKRL